MNYQLWYDIQQESLPWLVFLCGPAATVLVVLFTYIPIPETPLSSGYFGPVVRYGAIVVSVGWTGLAGHGLWECWRAKQSLHDGSCHTVEGVVEKFQPAEPSNHLPERFWVKDVRFEYSKSELIQPGYATTDSVIREGRAVRITYWKSGGGKNRILRLEVGDVNQ